MWPKQRVKTKRLTEKERLDEVRLPVCAGAKAVALAARRERAATVFMVDI